YDVEATASRPGRGTRGEGEKDVDWLEKRSESRRRPWANRRDRGPIGRVPVLDDPGPFDVIGDIHGCADEHSELLERLGYDGAGVHPEGRRLVFLGDLTDRSPKNVAVLRKVTGLVSRGRALYTPGNHCDQLYRYLSGRPVQTGHGLADTIRELDAQEPAARHRLVRAFRTTFETAPVYLNLYGGRLVVGDDGCT